MTPIKEQLMDRKITVSAFQFPVAQNDPATNLTRIQNGLKEANADIVVLPELCTTGYFLAKEEWIQYAAKKNVDDILDAMIEMADQFDTHLVFTIPVANDHKILNAGYLVNGTGIVGMQPKIHVTDFERSFFSPPKSKRLRAIHSDMGIIAIISCFDLWDADLFRQAKTQQAGLICAPCAFGSERTPIIARARSMEFCTPLAMCNRTGTEIIGETLDSFIGQSAIWDEDGNILTIAQKETECIQTEVILNKPTSLPFCANLSEEMAWHKKTNPTG
ncbi:carbon-nitrogen hydrolase family protein [Lunatimonas lonarensis]|nr:carbon-nitrogen hydrolase family protein [Lunatimonas lonarensis]